MTNKKGDTKLFRATAQSLPGMSPAVPILIDFEKAVRNSIKTVFPECLVRGCFFHFSRANWRQIQSLGLQHWYAQDLEFALEIRQLTVIAFVPVVAAQATYDMLINSRLFGKMPLSCNPFLTTLKTLG